MTEIEVQPLFCRCASSNRGITAAFLYWGGKWLRTLSGAACLGADIQLGRDGPDDLLGQLHIVGRELKRDRRVVVARVAVDEQAGPGETLLSRANQTDRGSTWTDLSDATDLAAENGLERACGVNLTGRKRRNAMAIISTRPNERRLDPKADPFDFTS